MVTVAESVLIVDKRTVGERIRIVRKFGAALSARALGQLLGSTDPNLAGNLEQGKGLTHERMKQVAAVCAGRGVLKKTAPEDVLAFLEGRRDDLPVVLDGTFNQMSYFGHEPDPDPVGVLIICDDDVDRERESLPAEREAA